MEQPLNYEKQAEYAAEKLTKVDTESTTSKYIQLKVPEVTSLDGIETVIYKSHPKITESDIPDALLMTNRVSTNINYNSHAITRNDEGNYTVDTESETITIEEPLLTSTLGQYGKIHVKEDRGGNVFLFDFTDDNKRIFLKHDSGTYWNIGNDGAYTFKVMGPAITIFAHDKSEIIAFNDRKKVKSDMIVDVVGRVNQSFGPTHTNIRGDSSLMVSGHGIQSYNGKLTTFVSGSDHTEVGASKTFKVGGSFIVDSRETIILRAPNISIETGGIVQKTTSPVSEEVNGERKISADIITLVGTNHTTINGGNLSFNHSGLFRHVIGGASIPPNTTAAKIDVAAGNYALETKLGRIDITSLVMGMKFATLLAGLQIDETGAIELANKIAGLNISTIGEVEMKSAMGSVKSAMSALTINHNVRISLGSDSATEPLVLGLKLMKWLNSHTHGTGTGPSTSPITPATPADFNSTKVFGS